MSAWKRYSDRLVETIEMRRLARSLRRATRRAFGCKAFEDNMQEDLRLVHDAVKERDLDKLRIYAAGNCEFLLWPSRRMNMEMVMGHLRSLGHAEIFPLMETPLFINGMAMAETIKEECCFRSGLYHKRDPDLGYLEETCQPLCDALYLTVFLAPAAVVDYVMADPHRTFSFAEGRNITDHKVLIEMLENLVTADASSLMSGVL